MSWATTAEGIMAAMVASGVEVDRQVIGPGPNVGRRCRQFTVYPETPSTLPGQRGTLPGGACTAVATVAFRAIFTADCCPMPGDQGQQPDPAAVTAWTLAFLADAEAVWGALVDGADAYGEGCSSVTIQPGTFTGPSGGVASVQYVVLVQPPAPY